MLAQTVQAGVVGQTGPQPKVLAFEDKRRATGVEENLAICAPGNGKAERVCDIGKNECRRFAVAGGAVVGSGYDRLGDLVDVGGSVLDLDVQAGVCSLLADARDGEEAIHPAAYLFRSLQTRPSRSGRCHTRCRRCPPRSRLQ